jgi:diadenosine tetraphosphate (Ap4A) HIT family hydrolase
MKEYIIHQTKYWIIKLNPDQAYLGRLVIVAKRQVESLSDLSKNEWEDFAEIVKKLESTLKKTFHARHFNWTCLMNNEFKKERYENKKAKPHVHWHCRPRYNKKIKIGNTTFEDSEFAHHYNNKRRIEISEELLKKIKEKIGKKI